MAPPSAGLVPPSLALRPELAITRLLAWLGHWLGNHPAHHPREQIVLDLSAIAPVHLLLGPQHSRSCFRIWAAETSQTLRIFQHFWTFRPHSRQSTSKAISTVMWKQSNT